MSLDWQDELQLENHIEELAEEHGVTTEYIADHLDDFYKQEDNIIEDGLEQWKETRELKKINEWWQMLPDEEKRDVYYFNRGK